MAAAASAREIVWETAWDRSPGDARSAESDERDYLKVAKGCDLETHVNAVKRWLSNVSESWTLILEVYDSGVCG